MSFTERLDTGSPRRDGTEEALRTRSCTLVVPDQKSRSNQLDDAAIPLHGGIHGIVLRSSAHANSPKPTTLRQRSRRLLASPTRLANVRVRRSNQTLLQSPARPSYTSRMRQLFEDASHGQSELQSNTDLLYPRLPNISRTAAPAVAKSPETDSLGLRNMPDIPQRYRPESLCPSTGLPPIVTPTNKTVPVCQQASQCSPGSWSDDSGYIVTHSRDHRQSLALPLNERIYDWLFDLADEGSNSLVGRDERQFDSAVVERVRATCDVNGGSFKPNSSETLSTPDASIADKLSMIAPSSVLDDPFANSGNSGCRYRDPLKIGLARHRTETGQDVIDDSLQAYTMSLRESIDCVAEQEPQVSETQDGGNKADDAGDNDIQLSPLSPNVCIKRGPSRYHINRRLRDDDIITTPCREGSAMQPLSPRLKENVVLQMKRGGNGQSPLAPRSSRIGTRFRPLQ